jgi:hypothetical protein
MKVNSEPEKPKKPRHSSRTSDESAKLKEFLSGTGDVLRYLEAILSDAYDVLPSYRLADYNRDQATLRRRFSHEGLSFATQTLPNLFTDFLRYLETGKPSYPSFKLVKSGKHPVFLRQLFAMVCECQCDDACTQSMQCIYQLCHAFKKFRGPYKTSTLQKQLWSFVEDDVSLRYIDYFSDPLYPILLEARSYVKEIIGDMSPEFDVDLFVPVPGPGATNTPRRKNVRYRPHVLYDQLDEVFPYYEWYFSHPWDLVTDPKLYQSLRRVCAPSSRFKFVPKTYGKPRGICIEELETQHLQQALKRALYDRLESHPLTKGFVNFTEQSINRKLALEASGTKGFATLDMSAASDRVSRTLVRYLFHDCPDMLDALMATSTRTISLPEGMIEFPTDLPCEKFAPMGSATCFPIMALVHFVLIKAILTLSRLPRTSIREIYVYGDDIIVRSECVDAIYAYLPFFGMKFNTEKSYSHSWFRESCGMHAYKGVEITPEYFKYIPSHHSPRNVVLSLLSTEARLFRKGFRHTAALLRSELFKVKCVQGYHFPYVTPKSPILGWIRDDGDAPTCRHIGLKRRYSKDAPWSCPWPRPLYEHSYDKLNAYQNHGHQRFEVRVLVARPLAEDLCIESDHEAYYRKLCEWGPNSVPAERRVEDRSYVAYSSNLSDKEMVRARRNSAHRFALADHCKTSASAKEVKDSQSDPPWIGYEWCPESAL